jgi:wyosine [tRNA(Phe)-imidazoG37] synthetase (radical SAM superfamily)
VSSASTVYGPVHSWRLGRSLGVDLLLVDSVCSFRCLYCQLGRINVHTCARKVYVPTQRVMSDLGASDWRRADVITLSGSGEPMLAANVGEVIRGIKAFTAKPVVVLTNAATLGDPEVRRDLCEADRVFCKLDAADEETFRKINRPVTGLSLRRVVEGIKRFKSEYAGRLAVQTMLMPLNADGAEALAKILREIRPDEVQLNAPSRKRPREWRVGARGNLPHGAIRGARVRQVGAAEAARFEDTMRRLAGVKTITSHRQWRLREVQDGGREIEQHA